MIRGVIDRVEAVDKDSDDSDVVVTIIAVVESKDWRREWGRFRVGHGARWEVNIDTSPAIVGPVVA